MAREVTIALAQTPSKVTGETESERKAANLRMVEDYIKRAASSGADVISFTENVNILWGGDSHAERPDLLHSDWTEMARNAAREHSMSVILPGGFVHEGKLRNAALVIDPEGEVCGWYFKTHLTYGERTETGIVPGDELPVFDLPFGRIGILICHDMSYLEVARCLSLKGAEILFWPSAWSGWGDELSTTVIKSRAIDNGLYLAFISSGQDPKDPRWLTGVHSRSCIVNPEGLMLATAERFPCLLVRTIDLDFERIAPGFSAGNDPFRKTMLAERRPSIYGAITDPSLVPAHPADGETP